MRDHSECQAAYDEAMARGKDGYAEYVMARCDLTHGQLTAAEATPPTPDDQEPA